MCDGCARLDATVAAKLGMDEGVVTRVRLAVYEAMRALDEAEVDVPEVEPGTMPVVTMVPLGLEPYILIRARQYRVTEDGNAEAALSMAFGGGLREEHVGALLDSVADSWALSATGGVTEDGAVIEPREWGLRG